MFYFGGMTLGYLSPHSPEGKVDDGNNVAEPRQQSSGVDIAAEKLPGRKSLINRANWFSFYW